MLRSLFAMIVICSCAPVVPLVVAPGRGAVPSVLSAADEKGTRFTDAHVEWAGCDPAQPNRLLIEGHTRGSAPSGWQVTTRLLKLEKEGGLAIARVQLEVWTRDEQIELFDPVYFSSELTVPELLGFSGKLEIHLFSRNNYHAGQHSIHVSPAACASPPYCGSRESRLRVETVECHSRSGDRLVLRGHSEDFVEGGWGIHVHTQVKEAPGAPAELNVELNAQTSGCSKVRRGQAQPFEIILPAPEPRHDTYLLSTLQSIVGWDHPRWAIDLKDHTCLARPTLPLEY